MPGIIWLGLGLVGSVSVYWNLVTALPDVWHYGITAGTGLPGVSVLWLSEIVSFFFFCVLQLYLWGSPFWVRFLRDVTIFKFSHRGGHIPSSWMGHAGCVFVAGIHPSRTWMSGSFESVGWNACVYTLGLYSHLKEFGGNGFRTHVSSKGKIPSTRKILLRGGSKPRHCITQDSEPNTLPTELFQPLEIVNLICNFFLSVAVGKIFNTDSSLRNTWHVAGTWNDQKTSKQAGSQCANCWLQKEHMQYLQTYVFSCLFLLHQAHGVQLKTRFYSKFRDLQKHKCNNTSSSQLVTEKYSVQVIVHLCAVDMCIYSPVP